MLNTRIALRPSIAMAPLLVFWSVSVTASIVGSGPSVGSSRYVPAACRLIECGPIPDTSAACSAARSVHAPPAMIDVQAVVAPGACGASTSDVTVNVAARRLRQGQTRGEQG